MKSTLRYFKLLPLLLVLLHFSCKHEPPAEPTPPCAYDCSIEEMKKYYFFKTGTWWVYQEESTQVVDTFYVYEHYEHESGAFGFSIHTSLQNCLIHYDHFESMNYACHSNPECDCRPIELARFDPSSGLSQSRQIFYPHIEGNYVFVHTVIDGANWLNGKSSIDSVNVSCDAGTYHFESVVKYHTETNALYEGVPTNYYYQRNVGLVKFENQGLNETWNLKVYSIIQ